MAANVAYVIATHNRRDDLEAAIASIRAQTYDAQEIVVVSDGSSDGTRELFTDGGRFDIEGVSFRHCETHVGAPKARNIGVEMVSADVYVFVDDDIVLPSEETTTRIVETFDQSSDVGALALRVENFHTGEILGDEFPHRTRTPEADADEAFDTTYFIGAGCAVRGEAFDAAGGFPESFDPNRFEEIDLAFRLIDQGYRIRYVPDIVVRHKRSPTGRKPTSEAIRYDFENRTKTAVRNLPWRYVLVSTLVWGAYTLVRARIDPRPLLRAVVSLSSARQDLLEARSVLNDEALAYVKRHDGRLYF